MNTIHPTAIVCPGARIGADCVIGPYCVVGEHVVLGDRCHLHSHVVVDGHTVLGRENQLFPFAAIGLKSQNLKCKDEVTRTEVGDENTFREHVTVHSATHDGTATVIGSHNFLMASVHVAHDCQVGSHITMANGALLAGHVTIEDYVTLGGLAGVHQYCRVGRLAMLGGCTKIVQDVPPYMIVDGNPSRMRTINKVGLERHGVSLEAQVALKQAFRLLFRHRRATPDALIKAEAELPDLPEVRHLLEFIRASVRGVGR